MQPTNAARVPQTQAMASASHAPQMSLQSVQPSDVGRSLSERMDGVSPPAFLGYATAGLIMLFGAGGTLFTDLPGEVKKHLLGGYAAGSVGLVLLASFVDSHHRISQRRS